MRALKVNNRGQDDYGSDGIGKNGIQEKGYGWTFPRPAKDTKQTRKTEEFEPTFRKHYEMKMDSMAISEARGDTPIE
jgi:hypothetical protein